MRMIARFTASLALTLISATPGFATDLNLYAGGLHASGPSERTYSWALEYRRPINENFSGSFTWLNEGHPPGHHRDGQAVQLWWHTAPRGSGPVYSVGLGPYHYFDTVRANNAAGYGNDHGWGIVASAEAAWHLNGNWLALLRINRVNVHDSIKSTALVAGVGYRFGATAGSGDTAWIATRERPDASRRDDRLELQGMLGATIVNSFDSDGELAKGIAVRMRAGKHLAGSLSYLNEGSVQHGRRAGLAPQIWLEDDLTERISVGAGVGPYFATRRPDDIDGRSVSKVSVLVSATAAYAISPRWVGRLTWNRVETRYDRDSDVITLGLGYRF